jgi:serine protease Do
MQNNFVKNNKWFLFVSFISLIFGIVFSFWLFGKPIIAEKPIDYSVAPETLSASFVEVAKKVESAVVNIDAKGKINEFGVKGNDEDEELKESLRRQVNRPNYAVGSGFIIEKDGLILTNFHVVEETSRITVRLPNGEEYIAKIIGADKETDVAVLKINAGKDLPTVKLGNSDSVQVGDWVLAIGSPFGLAQTVTAGIISQTQRETPFSVFQKFIQTDAAINRGNSGGPLVNMNGEVIGVNSQIASTTGDYNGIGFALPSNDAKYVLQQILTNGKVKRGYLGVGLDSIKPAFAKVYEIPETNGAIITSILDKESPASKAGLQVHDVIINFNNQTVTSSQDMIVKVALTEPEKEVPIIFYREINNKVEKKTALVKLTERPSDNKIYDADVPRKLNPIETKPFGLTLVELTPTLATTNKLDGNKGLLIKSIDQTSFISEVRNANGSIALRENDLIQRINRQSVTDLKTFNETVSKLKVGDAVVLHIANYNRSTQKIQTKIVSFTIQ